MDNITYILPTRIESNDRLKNIITSVTYLLTQFPKAKVIVKEVDKQSVFAEHAIPYIERYASTVNLRHIFEQNDEDIFHKTRYLNDLIMEADTEIVASHDVDVIYPVESHQTAYTMIKSGEYDVVYPYGCGIYQYQVDYPIEVFEQFLENKFDLNIIAPRCRTEASTIGWTQFYNRAKVIEGYMWNEAFLSWGAEDCEFYFRFNSLGYKVGRVDSNIFHFEHARTHNSHYHNPKFIQNDNLWRWLRCQNKKDLIDYFEHQPYIVNRRSQSNAGI
jgi:hypothetical protein